MDNRIYSGQMPSQSELKLTHLINKLNIPVARFRDNKLNGLMVSWHGSTHKRKRPEQRLVKILVYKNDELVFKHVEASTKIPSDELVTKLMLIAPIFHRTSHAR